MEYPNVIEVTIDKNSIDNGECGNPMLCPVALALYNSLGMNGLVGIQTVYFNDFDAMQTHEYETDIDTQDKIAAFDRGEIITPFICTLKKVRII